MSEQSRPKASTSWRDSSHRKTYLKLALRFFTTPGRIYAVAHAQYVNGRRDVQIHKALRDCGIVR